MLIGNVGTAEMRHEIILLLFQLGTREMDFFDERDGKAHLC